MTRTNALAGSLTLLALMVAGCTGPVPEVASEVEAWPEILGGRFTTTDGTEIVYDLLGKGDITLAFVHCWACNRGFWQGQLESFSQDYRVLAMDLAGHGESSALREGWSVAGLADDVRQLVEGLELETVILVGHSMGGPVALLTAPLLPERVVGIACVDTLHNAEIRWDAEALAPILGLYSQGFAAANRQFVPMMFPPDGDPEIIAWVIDNADRTDSTAAMSLMDDFPNLDMAALLAGAGVPVRCVNAAPLGQIIPATAIEINRRHADFDAATLDGVGHYLMLEKPAEFNALLAAAVEELASKANSGIAATPE